MILAPHERVDWEDHSLDVVDLRNQFVRFKVADIYLPDPLIVLNKLHGEDMLEGRVVDISDDGTRPRQFAVIEVPDLDQVIIVPLERIKSLT